MTTSPPPKKPGTPAAPPAPGHEEFDEDAPTSVVPGRGPRPDMPREFDEGGALDDAAPNDTTNDETPTKD